MRRAELREVRPGPGRGGLPGAGPDPKAAGGPSLKSRPAPGVPSSAARRLAPESCASASEPRRRTSADPCRSSFPASGNPPGRIARSPAQPPPLGRGRAQALGSKLLPRRAARLLFLQHPAVPRVREQLGKQGVCGEFELLFLGQLRVFQCASGPLEVAGQGVGSRRLDENDPQIAA